MPKPFRDHLKSSADLKTSYAAVRAGFVPLALNFDCGTLPVDRGIYEELILGAVLLQPGRTDAALFTILDGLRVLGCDDHIVVILFSFQDVPVRKTEDIGQGASVSEIGFNCVYPLYWSLAA